MITRTIDRIGIEAERGANEKSVGKCAMYVRLALERAGINVPYPYPPSAYLYAKLLPQIGFVKVSARELRNGTIAVWSESPEHPHGHICVKNNEFWYSDFKQKSVMCWYIGAGSSHVQYFNYVGNETTV